MATVGTTATLPRRRRSRGRRPGRGGGKGAAFAAPFLLLFFATILLPIGFAGYESLRTVQRSGLGFGPSKEVFNGLHNYGAVFDDSAFVDSILRLLKFGVVQVPVMMLLALGLALLLDSSLVRRKATFRLAFFLPYAVPSVIAVLMWSFQYLPGISPVLEGLSAIGLHPDFLAANTVLWSMANIVTWTWTGYDMLIFLAALQAIPKDLYDSARTDGASGWQIAWHIKIPLVRRSLLITGLFSVIGTLQLFTEPEILHAVTRNISSNYTPNMIAYTTAFDENNYDLAAAVAVLLAVVTGVFSALFLKATQQRKAAT